MAGFSLVREYHQDLHIFECLLGGDNRPVK
ncbi:hypothetical protein SAMN05216587_10133 [Selenomonas ruminantium]|uniref:Uncharacterized protein n=1 Tax=Selenomonas ruminantium TaxID=971 RepID=A0A1I0V046_SELRU|nr:hypothetical protein SAMN05216587_10133 [Selenomonas ruminantium]